MASSTVFTNNRTQAVRLRVEARFPESVKKVDVCEVFNRRHGQMVIPVITLAELLHSAEKSSGPPHNLAVVDDYCGRMTVWPYTDIVCLTA